MKVLIDSQMLYFQPQQYTLFMALWNARGKPLSREEIADQLWPEANMPDYYWKVINDRVFWVRQKLTQTRFEIVTNWTRGYHLIRKEQH